MISLYVKNSEGVWFGVACDGEEVYATTFAFSEERALRSLMDSVPLNAPFQQAEEASPFIERVIAALKDVYNGKDTKSHFSLATGHLPAYTRKVIEATYSIPAGYVTSYGSIANAVGGGSRAVGNIMAMNPFAPIVPCHRVVRSDLSLGGYGGGLDVKLQILHRERRGFTSNREIVVGGKKLRVFPVEFVLQKANER